MSYVLYNKYLNKKVADKFSAENNIKSNKVANLDETKENPIKEEEEEIKEEEDETKEDETKEEEVEIRHVESVSSSDSKF